MAQFVRPASDLDNTGVWTTTPLWSKIDEGSPGDSTYAVSDATPASSEPFTVDGSTVTDPAVSTGHILRARWSKQTNTGFNYRGVLQLRQGYTNEGSPGTLIATLTGASLDNTLTTETYTLSGAEADSITDYADLQLRVYAEKTGGGSNDNWQVEFIELEVPNAGTDATATPSSVAAPVGIPAVTVTASVEKAATAVAGPAAVPLPTVTGTGDATATPAAVASPGAVPQPGVSASVEQGATAVPAPVGIPQVTVTASVEKALAAVAVSTGIPAAALTASVNLVAGTVTVAVSVPLVTLLTGAALAITALGFAQFHRINNNLVLSPIGHGTRRGFETSEGFERVSDVFRIDNHPEGEATTERAMITVSSAWSANSGAAAATLKAAIHSALSAAGFRASDGTTLP